MVRIVVKLLVLGLVSSDYCLASEFKVVAGSSVGVSRVSKQELRELYMGVKSGIGDQTIRLSHGPIEEQPMLDFLDSVLDVSARKFVQHWRIKFFASRGFPPKKFKSDEEVLAFLKTNPKAMGVVSTGTSAEGLQTLVVQ